MKGIIPTLITATIISSLYTYIAVPRAYKEGQIDAISGDVKYKLVISSDSTKTWKEI